MYPYVGVVSGLPPKINKIVCDNGTNLERFELDFGMQNQKVNYILKRVDTLKDTSMGMPRMAPRGAQLMSAYV